MRESTLHDGDPFPPIGFGTWKLDDNQAKDMVSFAIDSGYRLIDTAAIYGNEEGVGAGIKDSGTARSELFVTTKLWNDDLGYESAFRALDVSLEKLGMEYVDLYLIHWPANSERFAAWDALIELQKQGKTKHIGVSNFTVTHLQELAEHSEVIPAVNQVEFHPRIFTEQQKLLAYCKERGIIVEAYSPLAQGDLIDHPVVCEIAERIGKTPGQVLIRWAMQLGTVPIPKSANTDHVLKNFQIFDFELGDKEVDALSSLNTGERVTHDPAQDG